MDQKILLIIIIIFLLSNNIFKVVKSVCLNFFYLIILLTIINFINPDIYKIIKKNLTLIINGETDYYNFVFKYSANKIKKFLLSFIYNDYDDENEKYKISSQIEQKIESQITIPIEKPDFLDQQSDHLLNSADISLMNELENKQNINSNQQPIISEQRNNK